MRLQPANMKYSAASSLNPLNKREAAPNKDTFLNLLNDEQDFSQSQSNSAVNFGGKVNAPLLGNHEAGKADIPLTFSESALRHSWSISQNLSGASDAIDEADFTANQGKRMNYYSTTKWDIGVYRDNSSAEDNPSVLVSVDESESGGSRKTYRVHINEVNMNNAACYEMFGAICCKTGDWFDALSSFKWALDDNYGMDRIAPDGSHPASPAGHQVHPCERLDFHETFRLAVEKLTENYDARLESVRTALLNILEGK